MSLIVHSSLELVKSETSRLDSYGLFSGGIRHGPRGQGTRWSESSFSFRCSSLTDGTPRGINRGQMYPYVAVAERGETLGYLDPRNIWHPDVRASACRTPRTSPNKGSERFVVRRKESTASSAGQPALTIARTICRPKRAGSDSGGVDGSSGLGARTGPGDPAGGFWTARVL